MTTLHHGAHTAYIAHVGQCYVDDDEIAADYATERGVVATVEIDLGALTVEHCEGYDHDANEAPADDAGYRRAAAARGIDVLVYDDEDQHGRQHTCYRLVSDRALAALRLAAVARWDDDGCEWAA